MSQAAFALTEPAKIVSFENVRLNRPVIVPAAKPLKIRLAALRTGSNVVEVVLRSEETAFQVDHFQATCRVDDEPVLQESNVTIPSSRVSLKPDGDLYGSILFQNGRFRRVRNYRLLRATECIAEITPDGDCEWFNRYLPPELLLGDPGARDAYIHAIQSCIPHLTILPVGVDRVSVHPRASSGTLFLHAIETSHNGNMFTYNLEVIDDHGHAHERWEGLQLCAVAECPVEGPLPEPLLGNLLERRMEESFAR